MFTFVIGFIHLALAGIVLLAVVAALLLLGAYYLYYKLIQQTNVGVDSDWKVKPPTPTLAKSVTITYAVRLTYTKGGKPQSQPYPGAIVTFSLTGPDATVDGAATKVVTTDANGEASVVLAPVQNGKDTLNLHLKAGLKEGDETPINFETVK
ncbi:MAG: hypothetical protein ABR949_01650 [Candidatus Aquilonibacter sp.]|jgi:hypothetical protein